MGCKIWNETYVVKDNQSKLYPTQIGKCYVINLQNGRLSLCTQLKLIILFKPLCFGDFFNNEKKKQALCLQRTSFLRFTFQISRGWVQFSAHEILEKAQFFSSGQRPWIISKMWLSVYLPSCAVALSQVTTSQCHTDTSNLAFSTFPDTRHVYCSFFRPATRSPPKSGHAFNQCRWTGSKLLDTKLS